VASEQDRVLTDAVGRFRDAVGEHIENISPEILTLKTEFQLEPNEQPTAENWIANELVFSPESAPALMLHLSAHPDELQRIAALSTPRAVSRELAKIEARLEAVASAGPGSKRDTRSKAPPPVRPVQGAPYVGDSDPGVKEGEDFDAWNRRVYGGK
jgi:hypothetical protein